MDVLCPQAVLVAVLEESLLASIIKMPVRTVGVLFVDDEDTSGYAGAVEEVGRQADDALDVAALDEIPANFGLLVSAKQHTMRQDDGALPLASEGRDKVQEKA